MKLTPNYLLITEGASLSRSFGGNFGYF
ncbi:uncharacterized protein METZ01_LOCUS272769 [marine metagenome]|uniref:Uncharacterized protein n=1 Tax=marine metagenome TaxID=408172 RepID=A0A382K8B9_9ZZZZ